MLRIKLIPIVFILLLIALFPLVVSAQSEKLQSKADPAQIAENNRLTVDEEKAGFKLLFDGEGFDGWKQSGNWVVQGDAIFRKGKGDDLVYTAQTMPDDFELHFDWKVTAGCNSGVYYRPGQYEYQILDNSEHRDGKNPRTSAASLYFCMPPSHDNTKPVGQWNHGRVICKGSIVQHWLNGEKVVGFDYSDKKYAFEVAMLKDRGAVMTARGANLSLQDHGDSVWYRNIKLRVLGSDNEIDTSPATPAVVPATALALEKKKLAEIVTRRAKKNK